VLFLGSPSSEGIIALTVSVSEVGMAASATKMTTLGAFVGPIKSPILMDTLAVYACCNCPFTAAVAVLVILLL